MRFRGRTGSYYINGCATAEDGCYLVTRQIAAYTHLKK